MANSTVISRKDMREPDRFQVVANQAAAWLAARKRKAMLFGGVAAAVVIVAGILAAVQTSRAEAAGHATSALLELASAPVVAQPPQGYTGKTFPTEEAKQQALAAEADKVLAQYGAERCGMLPLLVKGGALLSLKQPDAAGAAYEAYLKDAPRDDSLRFGALLGLGLVAEAKKDPAGAAKAYERMAQEAPRYADRADLERARVLAAAGKVDEAKQLLTKFGENHKETSLAGQAAQQLAQLGAAK